MFEDIFLFLIFGLLGGIWRRYFGMSIGRRSFKYCLIPFLCLPTFFNYGLNIFLIVALISGVYWSFGHTWDKGFWPLFLRYGVPSIILGLFAFFFGFNGLSIIISGVLVAFVYNFNYNHQNDFRYKNPFLDGYGAYSELLAGFFIYSAITTL